MESVSLEMDDIFQDRFQGGEDDDELPLRLPDLPEGLTDEAQAEQNDDDDAENQEVQAKLKGMKGASKNTVKRPQPKLDSTRLTGERGIPVLPHIFKDVKLKGKGNEAEDLRVVMRYLEHWAHRLFPKMPFDEVLERIERLGTKREVQTCIKKMRLDMPVLAQDMQDQDDDDGDHPQEPSTQTQQQQQERTAADLFDELLREEEEIRGENSQTNNPRSETGGQSQTDPTATATPTEGAASTSAGLSADVLERIERNRRLAMERRANKTG
ncbi:hypothetical protein BaRGS_00016976, partial [Batillaria attramentaria]